MHLSEPEISPVMFGNDRNIVFSPTPIETQMGYSRGIRVGSLVFLAGTTAIDANGKAVAEDASTQTDFIIRKMKAALGRLGADLEHIVSTTTHLSDLKYFDDYAAQFHRYFARITPVNTTVQAPLLRPDLLVEITATAVIPLDPDRRATSVG